MKKPFYIIRFVKLNKNTYNLILSKNKFFEVLGSYTPAKDLRKLESVFVDKDRLFF